MVAAERPLRIAAGFLAIVVAGIHAYWALPTMALQLSVRQFPDPRPAAFLLATMAILMGIVLYLQGFDPLPIYVGGIALMTLFIVGYVAWHTVLSHGAFWPGRRSPPHTDASLVALVVGHLAEDGVALASKLAETALLAVLAALTAIELGER